MKPIFEEACSLRWIDRDPIRAMRPFGVGAKTRDEFTLEETKALFCWETAKEVWTPPTQPRRKGAEGSNFHSRFEPLRA